MLCPNCHSNHFIKNGIRKNKKQNHVCLDCGRQFVENPSEHYSIPMEIKELIDRLLLEKISLAGIARAVQISESWLQSYVNEKYDSIPHKLNIKY
jgi:transposase-like protein